MGEPFIGEIQLFPYNFAPLNWAYCNGQLVNIGQYPALASILGTAYGGNGQTTFGLPNLQGQVAVGMGQGPGLTNRVRGQAVGAAAVTLNQTTTPNHTHTMQGTFGLGSVPVTGTPSAHTRVSVATNFTSNPSGDSVNGYNASNPVNSILSPTSVLAAGGGAAHGNQQPFLALSMCIAMDGVYPVHS